MMPVGAIAFRGKLEARRDGTFEFRSRLRRERWGVRGGRVISSDVGTSIWKMRQSLDQERPGVSFC